MSVVFDRVGRGICTILLNRPAKRNALNLETIKSLQNALTRFQDEQEYRVAILGGIGGAFCAGYDLNEFIHPTSKLPHMYNIEQMLWPLGTNLSDNKITIAAIDGHAAGFGFELALKCDFRVAERDARLGFLNRRFGIPILNGGTVVLPKLLGTARSTELIALGKAELASDALQSGMITHIADIGCSLGRSVNLARSLAKFPQEALIHDLNKVRRRNIEEELELLRKERKEALEYLKNDCGPLELADKFLKGEIGRHGNMDLGNLLKPESDVTL